MYTDFFEAAKMELETLRHVTNFEKCSITTSKEQIGDSCKKYKFTVKDFKVSPDRADSHGTVSVHLVAMVTYFTAQNWLHPTRTHKKLVVKDAFGYVACSLRYYAAGSAVELLLDYRDEFGSSLSYDTPYTIEIEIDDDDKCVF